MSTISAIQKTIAAQSKAKAVKVEPNSADTSLVDGKEVGVLVSGSNGTTGVYSGSVTVEAGDSGHGRLGGDVTISSGDGIYAGVTYVFGGSNLNEPPLQHYGGIYLQTGGADGGTSTTSTGLISINTGNVSASTAHSGYITIKSGSPHNHTNSTSGHITIETGGTSSTANAGHTGNVEIGTGRGGTDESGTIELITGRTSTASSGNVIVNTGMTTTATSGTLGLSTGNSSNGGDSGAISMYTGTTALAGTSGSITIQSGDPTSSGSSGMTMLRSGDAASGSSGAIFVNSGSSASADSGTVYLYSESAGRNTGALEMRTGNSSINGNSGVINLYTGNATNATHSSGAISIYSGEGHTTSGALDLYSGISNLTSGAVSLHSGDATSTESGAVSIYSGDSTGGNSGAVSIKSGASGNNIGDESGDITIQTGDSTSQSGTILIKAGESSSSGGHVQLVTSNVTDPTAGNSGGLWFQTGSQVSGSDTGNATFKTGSNTGTGLSGYLNIYTGDADGDSTGDLEIKTGFTPANNFTSGEITIATGGKESAGLPATATSSDLGNSGDITLRTGNTYDVASGDVNIKTGDTETTGSGSIYIQPGSQAGSGGDVYIEGGDTSSGQGGQVYINAGESVDPTFSLWGVQVKGSSVTKTSPSSHNIYSLIEGGEVTYSSTPAAGTARGGDVQIRGGIVIGPGSTLLSSDDGTGDQDLGEVKVVSGSVPTESQTAYAEDRLLSINHEGILKALNLRIIAVGNVSLSWSVGTSIRTITITANIPSLSGGSYVSGIFTIKKSSGTLEYAIGPHIEAISPGAAPGGGVTLKSYASVTGATSFVGQCHYILYAKL